MFKSIWPLRLLVFLFVFVTAFSITGKAQLAKNNIDWRVVAIGNTVLFVASLIAFLITLRSIRSSNPQAFVRAMYGSFMAKFFLLAIAAFAYIISAKKDLDKNGLIICAGLYIAYSILETSALTRLLKKKKNA